MKAFSLFGQTSLDAIRASNPPDLDLATEPDPKQADHTPELPSDRQKKRDYLKPDPHSKQHSNYR